MTILSLDLGTTTITGLLLAGRRPTVLRLAQRSNDATLGGGPSLHAEQDAWRLRALALEVLSELASSDAGTDKGGLRGLTLTGQMHGLLCVDVRGEPLSPLITWQDRRTAGGTSVWTQLQSRVAGLDWRANGCRIQHGYGAATLFWLVAKDALPAGTRHVCSLAGWLAGQLTGQPPTIDPTFAASWGVFDLLSDWWNRDWLEALGLDPRLFPQVLTSGEKLGGVLPALARQVGLPDGLPVLNPLGDNQASYLGSVLESSSPAQTVVVNLGTGGQVCWAVPAFEAPDAAVETRPLPWGQPGARGETGPRAAGPRFLRVGASLCGGAAYAWLNRTVRAWLAEFDLEIGEEELYERLNDLAVSCSDTRGLRARTTFLGVRGDPAVEAGAIEGITLGNMSLGALARATLSGMVDELHGLYDTHGGSHAGARQVVASGGAVERNPLLRPLIEQRFRLPVRLGPFPEPAAVGAAWLARQSQS
jgi:sedoheptulokinase